MGLDRGQGRKEGGRGEWGWDWGEYFGAALVNDASPDAAAGHPHGHHQASWAGADDEDIDVVDWFLLNGAHGSGW